ncbi:hypothetical protein V518_0602 [Thermoanaerobacterium aotearoense SCUT27]|uniref:Uncharacterized protein n=2 Tax=Thermoanaerobacterium TaxID=28895 RepID=W9EHU7_9THEO|nr:hypothetical protein Tsac_1903 [Thermoanaerobacterium saccharolyticum JW/SL-YS485]ETO39284.1 hypothetical protein V518_0602 [Thermoanaerobacterium aotearoense SCUT27]
MRKLIIIFSIIIFTLSAIYFLKFSAKKVPDSAILVYLKEELEWL